MHISSPQSATISGPPFALHWMELSLQLISLLPASPSSHPSSTQQPVWLLQNEKLLLSSCQLSDFPWCLQHSETPQAEHPPAPRARRPCWPLRPVSPCSPHNSFPHQRSFSSSDFRALRMLFPHPVMSSSLQHSLGLMNVYLSCMLLLKCLQLRLL